MRPRLAGSEIAAQLGRPSGRQATTRYLDDLDRRPRISEADERELVAAARAGDGVARERLVEACLPLIGAVARVYRDAPRVDRVELLQEGVVGLLRALERYDPDRGTPFWGYASWWVRQAMQQLVAELTRPAVLSDRALRQLARLRDAHGRELTRTGREPTPIELAERAGLQLEQVEHLLAADRPARSTDEPVEGDEGQVGTFGELLADPLAADEYERVLDSVEAEGLHALLAGLSDRERDIVRARYGLGRDEESLRDLAQALGISAERVRQLEQRALAKLAAAAGRG